MIEVAAAIIEDELGRLLIARRGAWKSQGGLWEFPGGKLESGETPEACLRRELLEEMNVQIEPYAPFGISEYDYGTVKIRLVAWRARLIGDREIRLTDHDEYRWARIEELREYTWAPADIPFVARLKG